MTGAAFIREIGSGAVGPVYLFTGPDAFAKREAMERLRAALLPPGLETLNCAVLEDATAEKILDAAQTMPVMCEKRLVEVRDWAPLFAGKSRNEEAEVDRILQYLEHPAESCVLIFNTRTEPEGKKRLTKHLESDKLGFRVDFPMPGDAELYKWAAARCKAQGCGIARSAADRLIFAAGRDRTRLQGELDKLCAYADGKEITQESVDAVVTPSLEFSVFNLLDRLLAGRLADAQAALDGLIAAGENRVHILSLLAWQLRNLAHVRLAMDENHLPETQKQLGMSSYQAQNAVRQARLHPAECYTRLYMACVETGNDIRAGKLREKEALNAFLLEIHMEFAKTRNQTNRARV